MTNAGARRVPIGLMLAVIACLEVIMVTGVDGPQKSRHLILDAPGCEGVRRLGLTPSPVDRGVCELEVKAAVSLSWIRGGNVDIRAGHLLVVETEA